MRRFILFAIVSFAGVADLVAGGPQRLNDTTTVEVIPSGPLTAGPFVWLALAKFRERLQSSRRVAQHRSFVFTGEVSLMDNLPRARCNSGTENKTYRIIQPVWIAPDSYATPGYVVEKGLIDCRQEQLPTSAFAVRGKVIVYCEANRSEYDWSKIC